MDNDFTVNSFNEPARVIRRSGVPEDAQRISLRERFSKKGFLRFLKNNLPAKGDDKRERVRKIIMDLSFVLFICSAVYLLIYYGNYRERIAQTNDFEEIIEQYEEISGPELEKAWNNIKEQYPSVEFPKNMNIKFAPLYAINQDVVGWLKIPNTNISTVILQHDTRDYYLYKDIYKDYSRYGNPYADLRCNLSEGKTSKNIIIYGHNTHDGLMFHQLINYMTLDGYKKAPVISFETLYEKSQWKIFAVMLTNSTSDADNGYIFDYLYTDFSSDSAFMSLMDSVMQRSMIHTGIDVQPDDSIITLYTCYQNIFKGGRLVIFARRVRDGESAVVDTSAAYYNGGARFPQAYYDKMGTVNPYAPATTEPST